MAIKKRSAATAAEREAAINAFADAAHVTAPQPAAAPHEPATAKPAGRTAPKAAPAAAGEGPRYLAFTRKEARLRDDQTIALTARARALQKAANNPDERITDNTLIRVAVDLLLSRADDLRGISEDELRASIGL